MQAMAEQEEISDRRESLVHKMSDKLHVSSHTLSSPDSDSESQKEPWPSPVKEKIYNLFGRETPVHKAFGGGKPAADVFLWRNKKISASVVAVGTAVWVLFELLEHRLILEVRLPAEPFAEVAAALRVKINRARAVLREFASGRDLKKFLIDLAYYVVTKDASPCIFGPIKKQRWSDPLGKQLIELIDGIDGPRMDIIPRIDGKPAVDVFLWRNKKISASVVAVGTAVWVLFELLEHRLVCHIVILALSFFFLWSNVTTFINEKPPQILEVRLPAEPFAEVAAALRVKINRARAVLREFASGWDLKKFLMERMLCRVRFKHAGVSSSINHVDQHRGAVPGVWNPLLRSPPIRMLSRVFSRYRRQMALEFAMNVVAGALGDPEDPEPPDDIENLLDPPGLPLEICWFIVSILISIANLSIYFATENFLKKNTWDLFPAESTILKVLIVFGLVMLFHIFVGICLSRDTSFFRRCLGRFVGPDREALFGVRLAAEGVVSLVVGFALSRDEIKNEVWSIILVFMLTMQGLPVSNILVGFRLFDITGCAIVVYFGMLTAVVVAQTIPPWAAAIITTVLKAGKKGCEEILRRGYLNWIQRKCLALANRLGLRRRNAEP